MVNDTPEKANLCAYPVPVAQAAGWDALHAKERLRAALAEIDQVLTECQEYFADRADADCVGDPLEFVPNAEMRLQSRCEEALALVEAARK